MGFLVIILFLALLVFIVLSFNVLPAVIARNLELAENKRRMILYFDLIPVGLYVLGLIISLTRINFLYMISAFIWVASLALPIVSWVMVYIGMSKSGCLKIKDEKYSPILNIVVYVLEFLALLLPIIKAPKDYSPFNRSSIEYISYNAFNIDDPSVRTFFQVVIGAIIVCTVLNLIFRDARKVLLVNIISQISYFALSVGIMASIAEYEKTYDIYNVSGGVSGGFGLMAMVLLSLFGVIFTVCGQGWSIKTYKLPENNSELFKTQNSTNSQNHQ